MIAHLVSSTAFALLALAAAFTLARRDAPLRFAILFAGVLRFAVPSQWLTAAGNRLGALAPAHPRPLPALDDILQLWINHVAGASHAGVAAGAGTHAGLSVWLAIWIGGAAACFALWVMRQQRVPSSAREPGESELAALDRARSGLGLTARAALRIVAAEHSPGASGWLRPTVILPDGLAERLTQDELTAVLAHELAHVARRDNLCAAVAHAIVCVFWFHPLLWWMERRMLLEREMACDELALSCGAAPQDYTAGILKICHSALDPSGYAAIGGGNLKRRMEHIMNYTAHTFSSDARRMTLGALATVALAIPMGAGFLAAQPAPQDSQSAASREPFEEGVDRLAAKDYAGAETAFREAYRHGNVQGLAGLVEALTAQGRPDEALAFVESEAAAHPQDREIQLILGNVYVRTGHLEQGAAQFEEMLKLFDAGGPHRADVYLRLGETYRRMKNYPAAIDSLQKARTIQPGNASAIFTLAMVLDSAGHPTEALQVYEGVIAMDPNNGVALNNLAFLIANNGGDLDRALAYAQHARELLPNADETADTLGFILTKRNQPDAAIALLAPLMLRHLDIAAYRSHLLAAMEQQGPESPEAERVKTALRQSPTPENQQQLRTALEAWPAAKAQQ